MLSKEEVRWSIKYLLLYSHKKCKGEGREDDTAEESRTALVESRCIEGRVSPLRQERKVVADATTKHQKDSKTPLNLQFLLFYLP